MDTPVSDKNSTLATKIKQRIATLPTLPSVITQLTALKTDRDDYLDEVCRLAYLDPTLTVRIVEYASRTIRVQSAEDKIQLKQAIARLGSRQISSLVMSLSLVDAFPIQTQSDRDLWLHAVQVGVISRELTLLLPGLRMDPHHAYLSGLLHDIGRFIVFQAIPSGPTQVDEFGWVDPLTLLEAENSVLGTNHVEVGSQACNAWDIPQSIIEIIELHHDFELLTDTFDQRQLAARVSIVQMADELSVILIRDANLPQNKDEDEDEIEEVEGSADEEWKLALIDSCQQVLTQVFERGYSQLSNSNQSRLLSQVPELLDKVFKETKAILTDLGIDQNEA